MDNNELLTQVLEALQAQTNAIEALVDRRVSQAETRLNIKIENDVSQRIEGLFDGYKLTHEKQWELERALERKTTELQMQIDVLQARLDKLESA